MAKIIALSILLACFLAALASAQLWSEGSGSSTGTVRNITGDPVQGAVVRLAGTSFTATTAADGTYSISDVPLGIYDVTASKPSDGYDAATAFGTVVSLGTVTVDFTLLRSLGACENDCTAAGSNTCSASCHGKGQCAFYSEETRQACDGTFGTIDLTGGRSVSCCKGAPYQQVKAQVSVPAKEVVKSEKLVVYQGKIVKLVTLVFNRDR